MSKISDFCLYMESIRAIQAQNIYKVNPVVLTGERPTQKENNIFAQVSGFNLNHPAARSATTANNLDFLA